MVNTAIVMQARMKIIKAWTVWMVIFTFCKAEISWRMMAVAKECIQKGGAQLQENRKIINNCTQEEKKSLDRQLRRRSAGCVGAWLDCCGV